LNQGNPYSRGNFDQFEDRKGEETGFGGGEEFGRNNNMNNSSF
jgi:hypothetical protein